MIVHFFTKGDKNAGSSRQRAFLVAENLNQEGIKSIVHQPPLILTSKTPWPKKLKLILQYLKVFLSIKKEDIIFLQRTIYNKYFLILIIFYKLIFRRKMIFDFDDAIYLHSPIKTKLLTKLSDTVIAGSHDLKKWAKKYNQNIFLVPTSISFSLYAKYSRFKRSKNKEFIIGWIGNAPAHYENLKLLVPVFRELNRKKLSFKFVLIGALGEPKVYRLFKNIKGLNIEIIDSLNWSRLGAVPRAIQMFEVGLMPLIDTEWNRGKCAFKAVEYMACGVPAIVSPVGENNYLIKDGINGFLANTTEEWVDKIEKLYNNPKLVNRLGREAQKTVKNGYSFEANLSVIRSIIEKL